MEQRSLGNSELKTSLLGLGGLHFGVFCDQALTTILIDRAFNLGVNFIDTAPLYGNGQSECLIGKAIQDKRKGFILSTKVGLRPIQTEHGIFGVAVEPLTQQYLRQSVEQSLRNLGTDYIDLLQLHAFDSQTPIGETLQTVDKLRTEGKIRYFGCSNYSPEELAVVCEERPEGFVASQMHYNMIERRAEKDLIPLCSKYDLSVICNRSLARGLLSGKYQAGKEPPPESRGANSPRIRKLLTTERLSLIHNLSLYAQKQGNTMVELSLGWLARNEQIGTILIGARDVSQLEACAEAVSWKMKDWQKGEVETIIEQHKALDLVLASPPEFFEK